MRFKKLFNVTTMMLGWKEKRFAQRFMYLTQCDGTMIKVYISKHRSKLQVTKLEEVLENAVNYYFEKQSLLPPSPKAPPMPSLSSRTPPVPSPEVKKERVLEKNYYFSLSTPPPSEATRVIPKKTWGEWVDNSTFIKKVDENGMCLQVQEDTGPHTQQRDLIPAV